MPLIKCLECDKEISSKAFMCPNCGTLIDPSVLMESLCQNRILQEVPLIMTKEIESILRQNASIQEATIDILGKVSTSLKLGIQLKARAKDSELALDDFVQHNFARFEDMYNNTDLALDKLDEMLCEFRKEYDRIVQAIDTNERMKSTDDLLTNLDYNDVLILQQLHKLLQNGDAHTQFLQQNSESNAAILNSLTKSVKDSALNWQAIIGIDKKIALALEALTQNSKSNMEILRGLNIILSKL